VRARAFRTTKVANLVDAQNHGKAKMARLTKLLLFVDGKDILPRTVGSCEERPGDQFKCGFFCN
jgi:hypothetical protein